MTDDTERTRQLVEELRGTSCTCGMPKKTHQTFCRACYYTLPQNVRSALYDLVGEGYEESYDAALRLLVAKGRVKS